jgi:hypothetical protein
MAFVTKSMWVAIVVLVALAIGALGMGLYEWLVPSDTREERRRLRAKAEIDRQLADQSEYFATLVCGEGALPDITTLPRVSVTLRFKAIKAKVCTPFIVR